MSIDRYTNVKSCLIWKNVMDHPIRWARTCKQLDYIVWFCAFCAGPPTVQVSKNTKHTIEIIQNQDFHNICGQLHLLFLEENIKTWKFFCKHPVFFTAILLYSRQVLVTSFKVCCRSSNTHEEMKLQRRRLATSSGRHLG